MDLRQKSVRMGMRYARQCFISRKNPTEIHLCEADLAARFALMYEQGHKESGSSDLLKLLEAASHALRSYQYGNVATELAAEISDACDAAIEKAKGE